MNQDLWRQVGVSAVVALVITVLYHSFLFSKPTTSEGLEYRGWRAGDYVLIVYRSSIRTGPDGLPLRNYAWCKINFVGKDGLNVREIFFTDEDDKRSDSMTNPKKTSSDSGVIYYDKIVNINGWPPFGPRKPLW